MRLQLIEGPSREYQEEPLFTSNPNRFSSEVLEDYGNGNRNGSGSGNGNESEFVL